jgi:hypothetical protein
MLILDVVAFVGSFLLVQFVLPYLVDALDERLVWQMLIALPMLLSSGVILAGILFELGQGAGVSSSEAVNWLPISPKEYVAASSLSTAAAYSPLFAVSAGVTLPLSLEFDLFFPVWSVTVVLSILALLLGALIVEILRAAVNRVSSTVYRRSGKFAIISRIVLVVFLFAVVQMAFSPYIQFYVLEATASIVDLTWFIPMIWPSVAITNLVRLDIPATVTFSALSVAFILSIFFTASYLRQKYWSPTTVSIIIESSARYAPKTPSSLLTRLGFTPLEAAIALKEFRALVRRRDLGRFIAVPVVIVISLVLPTVFSTPDGDSGRSRPFYVAVMVPLVPLIIPSMLSSISIGQEGKAVVNLLMLPIKATSFIKGKLVPPWIISIMASAGTVFVFQMLEPVPLPAMSATIGASILVVIVEGFVGLGVAVRYPDFSIAARGKYITFTGLLIGLAIGGPSAIAIFAPIMLHIISIGGGTMGEEEALIPPIDLTVAALTTTILGSALSYLTYRYCRRGVERFLLNLEA